MLSHANSSIGVFDSGVGGLSVLRAIRELMPEESVIYFGDQRHVPYGPRPMKQIQNFSEGIVKGKQNVANLSTTAAALKFLRETFPNISFVGMEPAVKPAAEWTESGVVGVLATPATFQGALYASVVERFATGVELLQSTCLGLVQQIEKGDLDGPETRHILEDALHPMLAQNIDTVVLGCTHYPFVIPLIERIVGDKVRVIDPAPSVARQAKRLLEADGLKLPAGTRGDVRYFTSGPADAMQSLLLKLLGKGGNVQSVTWLDDHTVML
ncbi:MAG: glutamate racemase [Chloroflexi bacterium]|nr:glutamate racemase [Chloroflexota bacterium]